VQAVPAGATIVVDGVERGVAPLVVDVEPGTPHHLELKHEKYETYVTDVSAVAGDKTPLVPALVGLPGSIRVETSIAGADVSLEGKRGTTPYLFENVPAGKHLVRIFDLRVGNRMYTAGEQAPIEVRPGETTLVSRTFAAGTGHLTIADAPPGSTVTIDGGVVESEKVFTTGIDVPAGWMDLTVQGPASQKWTTGAVFVGADGVTRQSVREMVLILARRTIELDGKTDSWDGIEPVVTVPPYSTFLGESGIAVSRFYLCRNDKDLFWRIDFKDVNPLVKRPHAMKQKIECALTLIFEPTKLLHLQVSYDSRNGSIENIDNVIDFAKRQATPAAIAKTFRNSDKMLVGRIGLGQISKFTKNPVLVEVNLANFDGTTWVDTQNTPQAKVDFTK
jgi:hypothetical protein